MKKIILYLFIGLNIINLQASDDFETQYYVCTMQIYEGNVISKRQADTKGYSNLGLVIKETTLYLQKYNERDYLEKFSFYKVNKLGLDVYGDDYSGFIGFNKSKMTLEHLHEYISMNNKPYKERVYLNSYICRKPSFFEKAMMIKETF